MCLTVINPACNTGHAQYAQRATMHITWTRLMSYWLPIIAKLCFKWTKYTVGLKLFLVRTTEFLLLLLLLAKGQIRQSTLFWIFLLSCLSSRQYKRLGGKSKWLHHRTSAVSGPNEVEATAQSVQWRTGVTVFVSQIHHPLNQSEHKYTDSSIWLRLEEYSCFCIAGYLLHLTRR